MNEALTKSEVTVVPADVSAAALQSALAGDLSKLTADDKLKFYAALCNFTGLNPLSKPFDWIQFQGKLTLYPNKGCAEQLRKLHRVEFDHDERKVEFGLLITTVRGHDKDNRKDFATAAVPFEERMPAADRASLLMKCETKAKRRMTLSICGLTMFARDLGEDEYEVEQATNGKAARHLELPETSGDRAAMLNELAKPPIDVESSPAASGDAHSPPTGSNTGDAAAPLPAAVDAGKPEPQASSVKTETPVTESSKTTAETAAPGLPDETVRNLEIVFSEKDAAHAKDCGTYLIAKKYIQPGADLGAMSADNAKRILSNPVGFHRSVEAWVRNGRK